MVLAGERIRAGDFAGKTYVRKGTTESVTSSTTVQNDDQLVVALAVGTWEVEFFLAVTGASGGDVRTAYTNTGTMSFLGRFCSGAGATTGDIADGTLQSTVRSITTEVVYGLTSTTTQMFIRERILVEVTVAGNLQLQWAQGTSSGTATVMNTSSQATVLPITEI